MVAASYFEMSGYFTNRHSDISQKTGIFICNRHVYMLSKLVEWHGGDSVSDFVSAGLQKVDPLKNTLDCGLPVTGFQADLPNCKYKHRKVVKNECTI